MLASHFQYERNTLHENKIDNKFPTPATVETNKIKLMGEFSLHSLASHYKFLSGSTCIIDCVSNTSKTHSKASCLSQLPDLLFHWVIRKFLNSERNQNAFYVSPVFSSLHSSKWTGFLFFKIPIHKILIIFSGHIFWFYL